MAPSAAHRFLAAAVRDGAARSGIGAARAPRYIDALTGWQAQFKAHRARELGRREASFQAQARRRPAAARRRWALADEDRRALVALLDALDTLDRAKLRLVLADDLRDLC